MTAQIPDRIRVRTAHGHVEVDGLSKEDVEFTETNVKRASKAAERYAAVLREVQDSAT
ncbi:hypothetical protein [Brevibacterium album]|uniref:hypothetical protein n=1 Tax=Brevibacterium album TaxID=417948 RepID=UPI0012EB4DAF|nr:hypothetical protein [Brevibacterium album]